MTEPLTALVRPISDLRADRGADMWERLSRSGRCASVRVAIGMCIALLALMGCASDGDDESGVASTSAQSDDGGAAESADKAAAGRTQDQQDDLSTVALQDRAIERNGRLRISSKNVADAREHVIGKIKGLGGYIADERSTTRKDGGFDRVQLELVVPTDRFDEAMTSAGGAGTVISREQTAKDVTEELVDVDSRIDNAKSSLRRIRLLLGRAEKLGDVIRLESVLGKRQADLESLQAQQKSLTQRTTTATIDVSIRPTVKDEPVAEDTDEAGFLAGLGSGWSGLQSAWTAVATVAGAILPFLVAFGIPLAAIALLVRRILRRRMATT